MKQKKILVSLDNRGGRRDWATVYQGVKNILVPYSLNPVKKKTRKFFDWSDDRHPMKFFRVFGTGSFFAFWVAGIVRLKVKFSVFVQRMLDG